MKTITNLVLSFTVLGFLAACGNAQKPVEDAHAGHDHVKDSTAIKSTLAAVSLKDDKLNAVYPHYVHLTKALTTGDVAEAKVAAQAIELGAKALSNGDALAALTTKITEGRTIEDQRAAFSALSNDLIARVKTSGLSSGELYIDHCPMAMDDKGAFWLAEQKEIKNPYFGDSMLTCGSVKETVR